MGREVFSVLCSRCRTPTGRGGQRARARARAPREGRAPRYQQHTSCVLLRTDSAPNTRTAAARRPAVPRSTKFVWGHVRY